LARRGLLPEWSSPPSNVEANLDAAATPITPDEDIVSPSERMTNERVRIIRAGLHPQQPADPGTPEQQANWEKFLASNPDAMQRYRPDEYEAQQAEVREKENAALLNNIKMKYGESEADAWLASKNAGRVYVPRTGDQISAAENHGATRLAAARGDVDARNDLAAANERYSNAVSRPRWAREAGLSIDSEETTNMSDGDLRLAAAQKRAADKQARELQWRAQLMMNRGNYAGAMALPGADDSIRSAALSQQNAALNANRAGGPINFGPTPLGVEATQASRQDPQNDVRLKGIEAQIAAANADRAARSEEFKAMMEDRASDRQLRLQEMQRASDKDFERIRAENARFEKEMQRRMEESRMEWGTRERMGIDSNAVEREKLGAAASAAAAKESLTAEREAKLSELRFQQQSPGAYDVIAGRSDTEGAADALKAIAGRSDRFQWLPGGGFGLREATAMNDELLGLARQAELLGMSSPLTDPAYRRELIKRYGYASGWSGGRGGWFGDLWQPMPDGLK
jgi:hypothetical protein